MGNYNSDVHHRRAIRLKKYDYSNKGVYFVTICTDKRVQMLSEMVRTFKAVTSFTIRKSGTTAFAWQREYYETIIRNEVQLDYVRAYIANNPATWQDDTLHPNMFKPDL